MKILRELDARRCGVGAILATVVLALSTLSTGCGQAEGNAGESTNGNGEETRVRVAVSQPMVRDALQHLRVNGSIVADRQVTVFSSIPGRIVELPVRLGTPVAKDQIVAVVDHSQLDLAAVSYTHLRAHET